MRLLLTCAATSLLIAGCTSTLVVPTASSIEMAQTAEYQTQNAPPPGFDEVTQFSQIDANLSALSSSHYTLTLTFDGVFSGSHDKTQGTISAEIYRNELGAARRVILKASGSAFGLDADRNVEEVRISNDYYLVDQNKTCTTVKEPTSHEVADLAAGDLIGGIKKGTPLGVHKKIDAIEAWEYTFLPDDVVPPTIKLADNGTVSIAAGDLWVAPSLNAVLLYNITLNIENGFLQGSRQLTGQVRASYKLLDTGAEYNISIPYGC